MVSTAASPKTTNTAASDARKANGRAGCHIITENDVREDAEQAQVASGEAGDCTGARTSPRLETRDALISGFTRLMRTEFSPA